MFAVMGITGKVGGATTEHLLAHGKEVRALVRNREKAANWANQGVELVDGDWNDSAAIEQALKGVIPKTAVVVRSNRLGGPEVCHRGRWGTVAGRLCSPGRTDLWGDTRSHCRRAACSGGEAALLTTGNDGGSFASAGPHWQGPPPKGVKKVIRSETGGAQWRDE